MRTLRLICIKEYNAYYGIFTKGNKYTVSTNGNASDPRVTFHIGGHRRYKFNWLGNHMAKHFKEVIVRQPESCAAIPDPKESYHYRNQPLILADSIQRQVIMMDIADALGLDSETCTANDVLNKIRGNDE